MLQGLARYQIQKRLGEGLYTEIFQALDLITHQTCVVKAMYMEKYPLEDKSKMFLELSLQSMVNHPNVIAKLESFQVANIIYVVLEFAPHGDLYTYLWVNRTPITDLDTRRLYLQICRGMEAIHAQGILHRDLKPENILIDEGVNAKVCDFGWACHSTDYASLREVAGTLAYMSPECLQGHTQTSAADIWSLGILIYEMYHGREPFNGDTAQARFDSICSTMPIFDPNHPPEAAELFYGCIKVEPEVRLTMSQILSHRFFAALFPPQQYGYQTYMHPPHSHTNQFHDIAPSVCPSKWERNPPARIYAPLTRLATQLRRHAMPHYQAIVETDKDFIREIHRSGKSREISSRLRGDSNGFGPRGQIAVREFRPISTGPKRKHEPVQLGSIDIREQQFGFNYGYKPTHLSAWKDNSCIELNQTETRKSWTSTVTNITNNVPYTTGRLGHTTTSSFHHNLHHSNIECNTYFMESMIWEGVDNPVFGARIQTEPIPIIEEPSEAKTPDKPKILDKRFPLRNVIRQNGVPIPISGANTSKPHLSFRQDRKSPGPNVLEKTLRLNSNTSANPPPRTPGIESTSTAVTILNQTIKNLGLDFQTLRKSNHTKLKPSPSKGIGNSSMVEIHTTNTSKRTIPRQVSPPKQSFVTQLMASTMSKKSPQGTLDKLYQSANPFHRVYDSNQNTAQSKTPIKVQTATEVNGFQPSLSKESLLSNRSEGKSEHKTDGNPVHSTFVSPPLVARPGILKLISEPINQSSLRQMFAVVNTKAKLTPQLNPRKYMNSPADAMLARYVKTKNSAPNTAIKTDKSAQAYKVLTKLCLKSPTKRKDIGLNRSARESNEPILTESHFNC